MLVSWLFSQNHYSDSMFQYLGSVHPEVFDGIHLLTLKGIEQTTSVLSGCAEKKKNWGAVVHRLSVVNWVFGESLA